MGVEAYRSLYGDLTKLKDASLLDDPASGPAADAELFQLLLAVSEAVDGYCNRHFYALTETRYFDGSGGAALSLPDLVTVGSLKSDDDDDGVHETVWAADEYQLLPLNAAPTAHWGAPHHAVRVRSGGAKARFEPGQARYAIAARWGYREVLEGAGLLYGSLTTTSTTLSMSAGAGFAAGQTLAVGSERMLVTGVSRGTLTVARGLNGTASGDHARRAPVSIVRWPAPVERAALINTARLWTRAPAFEPFYVDADLDTDVRMLLAPYRLGAA